MELDITKQWDDLTDSEKLAWTLTCNEAKLAEVKKFAHKKGIPFENCKHMLEYVNPMQRWYEARSKELRKLKRQAKK